MSPEEHARAIAKAIAEERAAARDARLEYDKRGAIAAYVVWSLKPGQPTIVAVCTTEAICERYKSFVEQHHKGQYYVESILLDHAFGRRDVQSAVYATAIRATVGEVGNG